MWFGINGFAIDAVYQMNIATKLDQSSEYQNRNHSTNPCNTWYNPTRTWNYSVDYLEYLNSPIDQNISHQIEIERGTKIITSPGAWGYLLTWKWILEDAQNKGYQNFLCLDDDVIFIKDFHEKFHNFIHSVETTLDKRNKKWKILQLGANELENKQGEKIKYYYHPSHTSTDGSFATAVDRSIYKKLIKDIKLMNCPFDSGPLRNIYKKYRTRCFVASPNLIIADVSESDIRESRNQTQFAERVGWNLKSYMI